MTMCFTTTHTCMTLIICSRQKVITAEEAREKSDDIMNDLVAYKQSMEEDMAKKENALHNKLSEDKKKQLAAKVIPLH